VKEVWSIGKLDPAGIITALRSICEFKRGVIWDQILVPLSNKSTSVKKKANALRELSAKAVTINSPSSFIMISLASERSSRKPDLACSYFDWTRAAKGIRRS
jgi:hypothetical protein